jgi:Zn-dependent protease with chaperone function
MLSTLILQAPSLDVDSSSSMPPFGLIVVFILGVAAIIYGVGWGVDGEYGPLARAGFFLIAAGGLAAIIVGALSIVSESEADDAAKAKYAALVSDWLKDDYSIDTNADAATKLLSGEALTAEYDGHQVVISLGETTTGKLSVIDENRTVLEPLNH